MGCGGEGLVMDGTVCHQDRGSRGAWLLSRSLDKGAVYLVSVECFLFGWMRWKHGQAAESGVGHNSNSAY